MKKEKQSMVDWMTEKFPEIFRQQFSPWYGQMVKGHWQKTQVKPYEEFIQELPLKTLSALVGERGPLSCILLFISWNIRKNIVIEKLAGTSKERKKLDEEFCHKLSDILKLTLENYKMNEFYLKKVETNPHLLNALYFQEDIFIFHFQVQLGQMKGDIHLALPLSSLHVKHQTLKKDQKFQRPREMKKDNVG
jgi:flagellar motor switch protein FliM